jgi:hypothetical protein
VLIGLKLIRSRMQAKTRPRGVTPRLSPVPVTAATSPLDFPCGDGESGSFPGGMYRIGDVTSPGWAEAEPWPAFSARSRRWASSSGGRSLVEGDRAMRGVTTIVVEAYLVSGNGSDAGTLSVRPVARFKRVQASL